MPDTAATRLIVTKAYDRYVREKMDYARSVPGCTKADVTAARKTLQSAIKQWESPGSGDPTFTKPQIKERKSFIDRIKKALKK
jgi:hypothetical protein